MYPLSFVLSPRHPLTPWSLGNVHLVRRALLAYTPDSPLEPLALGVINLRVLQARQHPQAYPLIPSPLQSLHLHRNPLHPLFL